MAEHDISAGDFRDAAVRAAAALGRLTELKAVKQGETEFWTLKAEIDPGRLGRPEDAAPVASLTLESPPAAPADPSVAGTTDREQLIDKRSLAKLLGLGLRTVEGMISAGRIPSPLRPSGRLVRWRAGEIDSWIRAGCPERAAWEAAAGGVRKQSDAGPRKTR